jgi:hypothetical protein
MNEPGFGLDTYEWKNEGYAPLVFSHDWQVALLNWEPIFDLDKLGEVERHNQTDEVFILTKGKALLITIGLDGLLVTEMKPGVIHNVLKTTWHTLITTRDVQFIIVENRGTHLKDMEKRNLLENETSRVLSELPTWCKLKNSIMIDQ